MPSFILTRNKVYTSILILETPRLRASAWIWGLFYSLISTNICSLKLLP
nr:MAG TPA: hypothetical protein [Caudoviricetes sp.]